MIENTIEALYRSVTDECAWPEALVGLSRVFDTPRVSLLRATASVDEPYQTKAIGFDADVQRAYSTYYWAKDPTVPVSRDADVGVWTDCDALLNPSTTTQPEYVNDYAIPNGLRYVSGAKLHATSRSMTVLSVHRPSDHVPFGAAGAAVFRQLHPHLARVAAFVEELRQTRLSEALARSALDMLDFAVFAVSFSGKSMLVNDAGLTCLKRRAPFLERSGRLTSADATVRANLEYGLKQARDGRCSAFRVRVDGEVWMVRLVAHEGRPPAAIVYAAPVTGAMPPRQVLRALLGLSDSEARIAFMIADGYTAKEIAYERRVSIHTVRAQLRAVLDKAGVRRQADLIMLLATLPKAALGASTA